MRGDGALNLRVGSEGAYYPSISELLRRLFLLAVIFKFAPILIF